MFDDKISSNNNYIIDTVTSVETNTRIIKRPYTNTPFSSNKKRNNSSSFKKALNSLTSSKSSCDDSRDFSELLMDELNDSVQFKNKENLRNIKENFEHSFSDNTIEEKEIIKSDSKNKAAEASTLYKKVELLNSLKRDSHY